jgi:hypothetical protein
MTHSARKSRPNHGRDFEAHNADQCRCWRAGDHDDRVVPLHSHKLTATLQHVLVEDAESPQRNPIVTRVEVRAGHGAGKPTEKVIAGAGHLPAVCAAIDRIPSNVTASNIRPIMGGARQTTWR